MKTQAANVMQGRVLGKQNKAVVQATEPRKSQVFRRIHNLQATDNNKTVLCMCGCLMVWGKVVGLLIRSSATPTLGVMG